jgi:tRNA (guanine37-N1)-methyltransferase
MFLALTEEGVVGQALKKDLFSLKLISPREFTKDLHKTIDDRPYGGGDGMLLMCEPLARALESLKNENSLGHVIYLSPQGKTWNTKETLRVSKLMQSGESVTLICGRYSGIDERIIQTYVDEEVSIGDYILSGGEIPAMVVIDSIVRTLPEVLGHKDSALNESFSIGYLEAPQFTRPREFQGLEVPEVLLSGNHNHIEAFRKALGIVRTLIRRPDILSRELKAEIEAAKSLILRLSDSQLNACGLKRDQVKDLSLNG